MTNLPTNLRKLLNSGSLALGSWITIGDNKVAEILSISGFDWLAVDLEHSVINIEKAGDLIRIISMNQITPLVRLTNLDENLIKRVMDAGAGGIIVPNISAREQVEKAVSATRYPPIGTRGVGLDRAQGYGTKFKEYFDWQKEGPVVIAQIENISAIKNLKDIFNVEGLDGFLIGPYDLSCSMGIPGDFNNPKFIDTVNLILDIGKKAGLSIGTHIVEPDLDLLKGSIDKGYNFIAYSVDIRMLSNVAIQARRILNNKL